MNSSGAPIKKFHSGKRKPRSETDTTGDCLRLLQSLGIRVWRQNSGGVKKGSGFFHAAPAGTADVIGYFPPGVGAPVPESGGRARELGGVFLGVETKCQHRDACVCESCKDQRLWGEELARAGGLYFPRIRSSAQLLTEIDKRTCGLILPS